MSASEDKKKTGEQGAVDASVQNKPDSEEKETAMRKQREFDRFCLWMCMPTMFKGKEMKELEEKYFIDDEEMQELCAIKNMKEFGEKYEVNKDTLTIWKAKVKKTDTFKYIQEWARTVNKNVVAATYRSAMSKDPKAHLDRKLMLQIGGWSEEQTVNLKGEGLFDILKKGLNIE